MIDEHSLPTATTANNERSFWKRRSVVVVGTGLLALAFFFALRYTVESYTHESTDDAFLDAHIVSLASKVGGQIKLVRVTENQRVKAGDIVVELDARDFQAQLEQKRAALDSARTNADLLKAVLIVAKAQVETAQTQARQTAAEAAASEATAKRAASDLVRAEELMHNRTISAQEYDAAKAAAATTAANANADREKAASDESKILQSRAQVEAARRSCDRGDVQIHQAEIDVQVAELNLSYTVVSAPQTGFIARKGVESGDYVQVGQKLMAIVPDDLYVTANFKETQLSAIRAGQRVKIWVDALEGAPLSGHVDSIQSGSGSRFSLLPPENAVGNYVKVVQRVPVKIVFDQPIPAGQVLGPGMSVVPLVHVSNVQISEAVVGIIAGVLALVAGAIWWRSAF
jgi:membrane fusion protein, multidrug efflux system